MPADPNTGFRVGNPYFEFVENSEIARYNEKVHKNYLRLLGKSIVENNTTMWEEEQPTHRDIELGENMSQFTFGE